jgi:large subunit ribosomal protein L17
MRHRKRKKRFGCRTVGQRKAMVRSLVSALFLHQKIQTIASRAKEAKRTADKLITLGKQSTVHARRQAFETLQDRVLVKKLFDQIAPAFEKRSGGYTRLVRLLPRSGDGAEMAILELTELVAAPERSKIKPARKPRQPSKEEVKPEVKPKEKKEPPKEKKPFGFLEGLRKRFNRPGQ